ncbi:MAG: ABC transporter permease [Candidatus Bathyarchaeota archaeon]|nr:ABC transporter permease [Candidatus Bathyarchaeota archaeon]
MADNRRNEKAAAEALSGCGRTLRRSKRKTVKLNEDTNLANSGNTPIISRAVGELRDIYSVLWSDLRFMRRHRIRTIATSLVNPFLYLIAFGYGLGRGISFEGVSYLAFVIPGILALTSMTNSFTGAASKLNVDRIFHKSFDELLMSPISLFAIAVGKSLIGVIRGMISATAILIVGVVISPDITVTPVFVFMLICSCFVFSFLGVFVAVTAKTHQDMNTFNALVLLPMTFLSGTFFSLNELPEFLKTALYCLPLTHSSSCLRATALSQPFPYLSFFTLLGFGVFFFACCMVALKRTNT